MTQGGWLSLGQRPSLARLILSGLEGHPMSGRELRRFLAESYRIPLEPATLLAALRHLEHAGWIFSTRAEPHGERIPCYGVTDAGASMLYQGERALSVHENSLRASVFPWIFSGVLIMVITWVLRLYPPAWRERYEQEMIDLLGAHPVTLRTWLDLLWNALDARLDPFYHRSVTLSPFRRIRYAQRVILLAFLLPLFSAFFYFRLFFDGLRNEYWVRNQHYPLLAATDDLGSFGIMVTMFCALLAFVLLAHQGIKRFGKPGDKPFHRLILIAMCLPVVITSLASYFHWAAEDGGGITMFVSSILFTTLLLIGWALVRWEAFKRAFLHLVPWLGFHLTLLVGVIGQLTYTPPPDDAPSPTVFGLPTFSALIAILIMFSAPISFVALMAWMRLNHQTRSVLLTVTTIETLAITLVQLMMALRLIALQVLGLDTIWTSELVIELSLNLVCTAVALGFLLTLLRRSRSKTPPTAPVEEWGVVPIA